MNYTNQTSIIINNENNIRINSEDVYLLVDQSTTDSNYTTDTTLSNSSSGTDNSQSSECFICFENKINGDFPFDINVIDTIYPNLKQCNCTGKIHIKCLYDWLKQSNTCPICRTPYNYEIVDHRTSTTNTKLKTYSCLGAILFFIATYLILSHTIPQQI